MTTYIQATLTSHTNKDLGGKVTKTSLRAYGLNRLEFVSQFHHDGSHFTGAEAVNEYGPVCVELRHGNSLLMIDYHPAKPPTVR